MKYYRNKYNPLLVNIAIEWADGMEHSEVFQDEDGDSFVDTPYGYESIIPGDYLVYERYPSENWGVEDRTFPTSNEEITKQEYEDAIKAVEEAFAMIKALPLTGDMKKYIVRCDVIELLFGDYN